MIGAIYEATGEGQWRQVFGRELGRRWKRKEQANGFWILAFKNVKILRKLIPVHYALIREHLVT